ncbi:MAG: hypothetical protein HEQ23_08250 [Tepidisphaera sp.]
MRPIRSPLFWLPALIAGIAPCAHAQPEAIDVGAFAAPASPFSTREYVEIPFDTFDFGFDGQAETLTVKWLRFELTEPISGDLFLDIDSRIYSLETAGDLFMALYDAQGNLIATDDTDGSFPVGFAAGLSFGSSAFRSPPDTPALAGQDGAELPAGTYYFALVAGNASNVTAENTNWNISTTASVPLGLFAPGTFYLELSFAVGNTTPLPPPANDNCTDALAIGESAAPGEPVWTGSNAGATADGDFPCYTRDGGPALRPKDLWFLYTPSASGLAEVVATGGAGGAATPILDRYAGVCGSGSIQCVGGASIVFGEGTRMAFPVTAGEPVLIALGIRAGQTGPMELFVNLIDQPCDFTAPANAVPESEAFCGDSSNDGCNVTPFAFDQLEVGRPVVGTLFNSTTLRDVDFFEFTLAQPATVTLTFSAQYFSVATIIGEEFSPGSCFGDAALFLEQLDAASLCEPVSGSVELDAGTHRLAIAHAYFDGLECGSGFENYWLRIDAQSACPADFNGDAFIDFFDYTDFVGCFEGDLCPGGRTADFNGDDFVDFFDYSNFVQAFEAGC